MSSSELLVSGTHRTLCKVAHLLIVAGFVVALLPALACSAQQPSAPAAPSEDQPKYGGVLDMAYSAIEPPAIDLISGAATAFTYWAGVAYSGILQRDPVDNEKIVGDLAERWETSGDGKTVTFYLRPGVKWSDGTPLTAADVKYTWDRVLDPNDPRAAKLAGRRARMDMLESVEAVNDLTIKAHLKYPSNVFLSWSASGDHVVLPKHAYDRLVDATGSISIGTGPYALKEWQRGSVLRYVKNPDYYIKDRPYLDGINIFMLRDDASRIAAFQTGQIKFLREIYQNQIDQIMSGMPQAVISKNAALRWATVVAQNTKPPFNDVRVRRAIDLALDRQSALQVLQRGDSELGGMLPPGSEWAIPTEELAKMPGYRADKTQDLAEAKRLLAEAGIPSGFKAILLTLPNSSDYEALTVWTKDQLTKIGIDAKVETEQPGGNRRERGDFDLFAGIGAYFSTDPSTSGYLSPTNFAQFRDKTFYDLLRSQDETQDSVQRKKLTRQLQDRFREVVPLSSVYWTKHGSALWPEVRGFKEGVSVTNNYKLQDVWLAK